MRCKRLWETATPGTRVCPENYRVLWSFVRCTLQGSNNKFSIFSPKIKGFQPAFKWHALQNVTYIARTWISVNHEHLYMQTLKALDILHLPAQDYFWWRSGRLCLYINSRAAFKPEYVAHCICALTIGEYKPIALSDRKSVV